MEEIKEEKTRLPELLKVLCILTFLGSGLSSFANLLTFLLIDEWKLAFEQGLFERFDGLFDPAAIQILIGVDSGFYLIQGLLYAASFFGAYLMWKLRKTGFHVYSTAQILTLIVQKLYLPSLPFPLIPLLLTITFILLYYKNLQHMK